MTDYSGWHMMTLFNTIVESKSVNTKTNANSIQKNTSLKNLDTTLFKLMFLLKVKRLLQFHKRVRDAIQSLLKLIIVIAELFFVKRVLLV